MAYSFVIYKFIYKFIVYKTSLVGELGRS